MMNCSRLTSAMTVVTASCSRCIRKDMAGHCNPARPFLTGFARLPRSSTTSSKRNCVWPETMVSFITSIKQFGQQGEKTGWTYIDIPPDIAERLKPGSRKSFRVKGKLDAHPVSQVALLPMGDGGFIIPLNADLRKALHKKKGALLKVSFREDKKAILVSADL